MNSIERCRKAIRWVASDRVPVVPLILNHAAALAGVLILADEYPESATVVTSAMYEYEVVAKKKLRLYVEYLATAAKDVAVVRRAGCELHIKRHLTRSLSG